MKPLVMARTASPDTMVSPRGWGGWIAPRIAARPRVSDEGREILNGFSNSIRRALLAVSLRSRCQRPTAAAKAGCECPTERTAEARDAHRVGGVRQPERLARRSARISVSTPRRPPTSMLRTLPGPRRGVSTRWCSVDGPSPPPRPGRARTTRPRSPTTDSPPRSARATARAARCTTSSARAWGSRACFTTRWVRAGRPPSALGSACSVANTSSISCDSPAVLKATVRIPDSSRVPSGILRAGVSIRPLAAAAG